MIISLVIALIAVAVAVAGWFRPTAINNAPAELSARTFSEPETAEARKVICQAYEKVSRATEAAGGETSDDRLTKFAIAISIRVTATLSADYLFRKLDENPATPTDLADKVYKLAATYQELLLSQIGNATSEELDVIYRQIDEIDPTVAEACK